MPNSNHINLLTVSRVGALELLLLLSMLSYLPIVGTIAILNSPYVSDGDDDDAICSSAVVAINV